MKRSKAVYPHFGVRIVGVLLLTVLGMPLTQSAHASSGSVYAINCEQVWATEGTPNKICATRTDFSTAAADMARAWTYADPRHLYTGLYIVMSQKSPLTGLVNIQGYEHSVRLPPNNAYHTILTVTSQNVVRVDGTVSTSDTDLASTDGAIFAGSRSPSVITKPVTVPPAYGVSYINNDALAEDTNTAIIQALAARGINTVNVAVGTVVQVFWQDGTSAFFIKLQCSMCSIQWAYVPGTARDKDGNPIDTSGKVIPNPHPTASSPTGSPDEPATFPASGFETNITVTPEPLPQGTVTIEWCDPNCSTTTDTVYLPVGG